MKTLGFLNLQTEDIYTALQFGNVGLINGIFVLVEIMSSNYVVNVLTRVGSCHPTIGDRIDIISIKNTRNPTFTNPCGMLLNSVY